ncbi:MAG: MBL fold metallo-hydrolase [Calditrichae bacterium]|nr:MBL fold metallo-hydrolase [Calditrichia bacterium]
MNIYKFTVGNFAVNNYLVHPVDSSKAILFDAGDETEPILKKIDELGLELIYLVNTHGHSDHIFGNKIILEHTGAQLLIHELDEPFLFNPQLNLSAFLGAELESPKPDRILHEGDTISLEDLEFKVLHTPGHTPGHISLLSDGHAFVGDVIFQGSVGRTDLPKSSGQQLIHTIRTKIYDLPDETNLYPGHGPNTTVGQEKVSNPFVSI